MSALYNDTAMAKSDVVNSVAFDYVKKASSTQGLTFNNDGTIKQTERLLTARPRYAPNATSQADVYQKADAKRGNHAYIKLLTSAEQANNYTTSRGAREGDDLTGPGSIVASMVSSDQSSGYDAFLITHVNCQLQEKIQITETFGDGEVMYYFGRQPLVFNISGMLIDSPDNTWFTDWLRMYSSVTRGSQLAQNYELLQLVLPNMILTGTISATAWDQDSASDVTIPFSFQFMAKTIEPTAPVLQNVTASDLSNLIDFSKASQYVSQTQINTVKTQAAALSNVISNPRSTVAEIGSALSSFGSGAAGSTIGSSLKNFSDQVKGWVSNNAFSQGLSGAASLFRTLSANLNGIRAQLFSPIYGVLTSLTKLVKNTAGDINSIFNSLFSPVRNILRDITNISNQATALVNLVNSSIRGIGRNINYQIGSTKKEFDAAMKAVGKAVGSIATSPKTILQSVQEMFKGGAIPYNAPFLQENKRASLSGGASLFSSSVNHDYKIAILKSMPLYDAYTGSTI
ncbi:MAG TPA: hypothetical protein VFM18_02740 [Methanosarcina sp.]|nr:hypothetical protein [Methanosarcina sp.]